MTRVDAFRDLDRLAGQLLAVGREPRSMPMDLYRSGDHYVMHLDLPGIDPGSVDVQVDASVLTIRAERSPRTAEDIDWLVHERPSGTYQRQLKLGPGVDVEQVNATLEHGVLTLTLPIAERAKPRRIAVTGGGLAIDAQSITQESVTSEQVPRKSTKSVAVDTHRGAAPGSASVASPISDATRHGESTE